MALCVDEGIKGLADNCKQVTSAPEEILSGTLVTDNLNVLMQSIQFEHCIESIIHHYILSQSTTRRLQKKLGKLSLCENDFCFNVR